MSRPLDAAGAALLAVVERSGFPESEHVGAAVVLGPDGSVRAAVGDVDASVYPRSALKPFQTLAALRAGARLDRRGLVIVTSSHTGTPVHTDAVRAVLAGAGLAEADLRTPEAWPSSSSAMRDVARVGGGPARIAMNCSGNHAGMLAGACASGWDVNGYLDPAHPIHALAEQVIAESCGAAPTDRGLDGCGGPVWAVPLVALARGYQQVMADEPELAEAIRAEPDLIEGPGTATTRAVAQLGVVAKAGAEGVWCAVAPDGSSVAVKVLDGSARASAAVAVRLLADQGALAADAADAFLADDALAIRGGGAQVGRVRVLV